MSHITVIAKGVKLDPEKEMIVICFSSEQAKKDTIKILKGMKKGRMYYIEAPGKLTKKEYDKNFLKLVPDYKEPTGSKEIFLKKKK